MLARINPSVASRRQLPYEGEPKLLSLPFVGEVAEQREVGGVVSAIAPFSRGEVKNMYKIHTLNAISDIIYTQLSADTYTVAKEEPVPDGILVRSAAKGVARLYRAVVYLNHVVAPRNNVV